MQAGSSEFRSLISVGKARVVAHTYKPSAWEAKSGIPGVFWPSNLAKMVIYKFNDRSYLKKQDGGQSRRYPILTSVLHVLLYTHARTYMNTYGAGGKRKKMRRKKEEAEEVGMMVNKDIGA